MSESDPIVERALEALRRIATEPVPLSTLAPVKLPKARRCPAEALDAERRFGHPHAKLFPYIGRKVRTPEGPGTLLQVFAERVTVLLDSELKKCAFFMPEQIEPASWEISE